MESRPPIPVDQALRQSLTTVYDGRVDSVLESLSRMGPRYYFRLNSLAGKPSETIESMQSNNLKAQVYENLPDAGYLLVTESEISVQGHLVEADRFAAESVMQGSHLYAPGVRNCQGLRTGMPSTVVDREGTPVGSGIARQNETMILRYHQGIAVEVNNSRYRIPPLRETSWYRDGLIHLQSLPAMVTCRVLDPQPDEKIVDLNCSPAGKMSYLCQLTGNKARVIGFDRNEQKIDKAREHLERLHCKNYQLIAHDSRYAHLDYTIKADKVLVDPPCTGLGVTPKLSIDTTIADVNNLSSYQKQFLTSAANMVKDGGVVVYSVCTITPQECEDMVGFTEEKLGLVEAEPHPMIGMPGLNSKGQRFDPGLDGVGFFIAKFVKKA